LDCRILYYGGKILRVFSRRKKTGKKTLARTISACFAAQKKKYQQKLHITTIALRVSRHAIARKLSNIIGRPIIATSANLSGKPLCYTITAVKKQFNDHAPSIKGKLFLSLKRGIFYSTLDAESIDSLLRGNDKEKVDNPIENIKNTPDLYINGGTLPRRKASTIVRVEKDGVITVLREGAIKIEAESAK